MDQTDKRENSLREKVLCDTQGMVDIKETYPNLWIYFERIPFMNDKEFWDEAKKNYSPTLRKYLETRFDNPFQPEVILFIDKSQESRDMFDLLSRNGVTMRVFPVDDNIRRPSIGWINLDALTGLFRGIRGAKSLVNMRGAITASLQAAIDEMYKDVTPDLEFIAIRNEIISIQMALAEKEMFEIQSR